MMTTTSVDASAEALALIATLRRRHGDDFFIYQAGGCCEGSYPQCFAPGDLKLTEDDVLIAHVDGIAYYVNRSQCGYLLGKPLSLDASPGSLGTFSLEDAEGRHFTVMDLDPAAHA